jgi:hypothetical protein
MAITLDDLGVDLSADLTTQEVAELFSVHPSTVRGWRDNGHIHPVGERRGAAGRSALTYSIEDLMKAIDEGGPLEEYFPGVAVRLGLSQQITPEEAPVESNGDHPKSRLSDLVFTVGKIAQAVDRQGTVTVITDDYEATMVFDQEALVGVQLNLRYGAELD